MRLAFAHEVFKVVPLDIVGEVADVYAAVLLRGLSNVAHHLLFRCLAVFDVACRRWPPAAVVGVISRIAMTVHRRAVSTAASVIVTAPRTTAITISTVTAVRRARARPITLSHLLASGLTEVLRFRSRLEAAYESRPVTDLVSCARVLFSRSKRLNVLFGGSGSV